MILWALCNLNITARALVPLAVRAVLAGFTNPASDPKQHYGAASVFRSGNPSIL